MSEKTYRLQGSAALSLPASDADKLLELGDGECALLYLHILRVGGELVPAMAAHALGRSEEDIRAAARRLDQAGLLASESPDAPLPGPEELRRYTSQEISQRADAAFRALRAETAQVFGRALSGTELQTLFGIYDQLGLPAEVIMLLIHHCSDRLRERYGEGRLPTMRAIEKEAFRWAREELVTLEQANDYLASLESRREEGEKIKKTLGIAGRALSPSERKYLEGWLALGYGSDALALAYDRTVVSTGKLTWAYMDKIVQSWHKKGLFTPAEIEQGDPRSPGKNPNRKKPSSAGTESPPGDDLDLVERLLSKR